jgi:CRP-like cAMP-binding protein
MNHALLDACKALPLRTLAAGETLITCGETDNRLYILVDGELDVSKDGVHINVQSDPGAVFGEVSVLLGIPHTASVSAITPSRLHVVDEADAFLHAHPDVAFVLCKLLARRLKNVSDYLVDIKRQFESETSHLSVVDEVLAALVHQQDSTAQPGSERCPDTAL